MSKTKMMDIGSNMSFNNKKRSTYSMENLKEPIVSDDKMVKIDLMELSYAPEEWNFYPMLVEEEFEKLVYSILEHGLLHPIVVRKTQDENIILSGHNRVRAYREIQADIQRVQNGEEGRFLKDLDTIEPKDYDQIMAVIKENISDDDAREIIIDANYVQRQLNPKLITRSIIEKYKIIQDRRKAGNEDFDPAYQQKYKEKKTREIVAQDFKLSGRHIDRYKRLEKLNEELLELFYEGKISLELASKLAGLKPRAQEHVAQNYLSLLSKYPSRIALELKPSLTMKDVDHILGQIGEMEDQIRLSIRENGKSKNLLIQDPKIIEQIMEIIKDMEE